MGLRFHSGYGDDFDDITHQMAESHTGDNYPTARQEQIAATLLDAATRLGEVDRQVIRDDLVRMARAIVASDAYTHPWGDLIFKPEVDDD
jgi:hypothetical protein